MIKRLKQLPTYWYPIHIVLLVTAILFLNHLRTGNTPHRVAFEIPGLGIEVFWYGLWIVGGMALAAYVVAYLLAERMAEVFASHVPMALQERPLQDLDLPDDIETRLSRQKIKTIGDLLRQWGLDPRTLALKRDNLLLVQERLATIPEVEQQWLTDAPWRIWNPDHVWNGIGWCIILGVIGARLYHILTPSPSMAAVGIESPLDYFRNPYQIINLRNGGLGIYGGIVGGAIGLWWYTRRHKLPTLAWADLSVIGLSLGQTIGRWGNFFNQELYGGPTDLPWAITIEANYRLPEFADFSRFHPAFLYESLWNLLTFITLLTLYRRYGGRLKAGDLTAIYLIAYAIGRTLLEMVRLDSRTVALGGMRFSISIATLVSLIIAVLMGVWLVKRHGFARFKADMS